MSQSYDAVKRHAASLEAAVARRESAVVEVSSQARDHLSSKDKDISELREQIKRLLDDAEREKMTSKEGKKQVRILYYKI